MLTIDIDELIYKAKHEGSATFNVSKFDGILQYVEIKKEVERNNLEIELVDEHYNIETYEIRNINLK